MYWGLIAYWAQWEMVEGWGLFWLVAVLGSFVGFLWVFLTECCQLFVYFQGTSSAKGSILLSYIFAFTIVY